MNADDERLELRDRFRELVRRLVDESQRRSALRRPRVAKVLERAIAGLDDLVNALADDPTEGERSAGWKSCAVCDSDPGQCIRGGRCAQDPYLEQRPERWEGKTLFLPQSSMQTINDAVERVRQIAQPQRISDSAAVSLVALDFVATHSFTRQSSEQTLRFIVETFEQAMRLFIMVFDRHGKLLYGVDRLPRLIEALGQDDASTEPDEPPLPPARRQRRHGTRRRKAPNDVRP